MCNSNWDGIFGCEHYYDSFDRKILSRIFESKGELCHDQLLDSMEEWLPSIRCKGDDYIARRRALGYRLRTLVSEGLLFRRYVYCFTPVPFYSATELLQSRMDNYLSKIQIQEEQNLLNKYN